MWGEWFSGVRTDSTLSGCTKPSALGEVSGLLDIFECSDPRDSVLVIGIERVKVFNDGDVMYGEHGGVSMYVPTATGYAEPGVESKLSCLTVAVGCGVTIPSMGVKLDFSESVGVSIVQFSSESCCGSPVVGDEPSLLVYASPW